MNHHQEMLESPLFKIFSSILWSLLKSVSLSFEKVGQLRRWWIVAPTVPQLQIGFNVSWKLWLNLPNPRWRKPSLSIVISFKPSVQWQWKKLFAEGLMKAVLLENRQTPRISYIGIWVLPFSYSWREEKKLK